MNYINNKTKFTEDMILVDPALLTDLFINEMLKIDILKEYFEEDA
jgi:hypothetical protein